MTLIGGPDIDVGDFDPVTKMRQQVSAEKLRLTLREIRQAHGELDAREEARRRAASEREAGERHARATAEKQRVEAQAQVARDAQARRDAEAATQRIRAKRREAIQQAKRKAVEDWSGRYQLSTELKAQILQAIEAALAPLPAEDLPESELLQIAEGVRDRIHGQATAAHNAAAARVEQKRALQRYGIDYAQAELRTIDELDVLERWRVEGLVRDELESISGDESRAEIKALVDDVLDEEGFGFGDDNEAAPE